MYHLGMCLFNKHNLNTVLHLDGAKVMKFLGGFVKASLLCNTFYSSPCACGYAALAEQWYRGGNPYHNGIHACDVTQALNCLISTKKVCTCCDITLHHHIMTICVNILTYTTHYSVIYNKPVIFMLSYLALYY